MDFEILSETQKPPTLLQLFERLITNRKRQWQLWGENPPHLLGWVLLLTVSLEMTMTQRMVHGLGAGDTVIPQWIGTVLVFLFFETLFAIGASKGAEIIGKTGNIFATFTYFNLSLVPFLLILPISMACWISGDKVGEIFRLLLVLTLGFKVVSLWKQSIEHTYKFTPLQSALVLYSVVGLTMFAGFLFVYIGFIRSLTQIFAN